MRRTSPPEGPSELASTFVGIAANLILIGVTDEPQRATRLVLACSMPADWSCWAISPQGVARRIGQRERGVAASDLEARLFATARSLCSSVVSRLELRDRSWLASRLDRREDACGQFVPHLRLTVDLEGTSWGLRCEAVFTSQASATVCTLGGVLRPQQQRAAA